MPLKPLREHPGSPHDLRPRPRRARLVAAFAALLSGLIIVLAIGEAALRWRERPRGTRTAWVEPDSALGYRPLARTGINELRTRERPLAPKGNRRRILIIGDSIAAGGADSGFVRVLERLIAASAPPDATPVEVWNGGIPGYTTFQEVTWYRLHGFRVEPDLIVLQFCLNDAPPILHVATPEGAMVIAPEEWARFERWRPPAWARKSALVRLVFERSNLVRREALVRSGQRYSFEERSDFYRAWDDGPWPRIESLVAQLRELAARDGAKLCILVFPLRDQFRADYLAKDADFVLKPQRKLREIADRLGIPLLDLYGAFDGRAEDLPDGLHPNVAAHARVANALLGFLESEGLLPTPHSGNDAALPPP